MLNFRVFNNFLTFVKNLNVAWILIALTSNIASAAMALVPIHASEIHVDLLHLALPGITNVSVLVLRDTPQPIPDLDAVSIKEFKLCNAENIVKS